MSRAPCASLQPARRQAPRSAGCCPATSGHKGLPPRGRRPAGSTDAGKMRRMNRKLHIRTFGCQMNEYDSDKMAEVLAGAEGYESTDRAEDADLILFNTCSVREKAQEKVFHDLGRIKHLKAQRAI